VKYWNLIKISILIKLLVQTKNIVIKQKQFGSRLNLSELNFVKLLRIYSVNNSQTDKHKSDLGNNENIKRREEYIFLIFKSILFVEF